MPSPRLLIVPLAAVTLAACVVAPSSRRVVYAEPVPAGAAYAQPGIVVDIAPPSSYVEVVPAIPYAGALWIGGYWGWASNRHQWYPGRWDRPRPGYSYHPHAWVQQGGRWHLHGGAWVRV
ncbi:MAG: hypothetical protein H7337_14245 [Rhizobacter sp.]|nr:hypothetical protein [Rhizobacter sp.]